MSDVVVQKQQYFHIQSINHTAIQHSARCVLQTVFLAVPVSLNIGALSVPALSEAALLVTALPVKALSINSVSKCIVSN
jgi:hypothetical protein